MGSSRWITKMDVLEDLRNATGGRVGNLESSYFIVGEKPPPKLHYNTEDHEIQLLHGGSVNVQDDKYEVTPPDLQGITKLIRMVDDYDKTDDENENVCSTDTDVPNHIISISKLNPNVKEFVPGLSSTSPSVNKIKTDDNLSNVSNENVVEFDGKLDNKINSKNEAENLDISTSSSNVHEKDKTVNDVSLNIDNIKTNVSNQVNGINDRKESNQTNLITCKQGNEALISHANTTNLDIANLKANEIKNIAAELKNKIVGCNKTLMNSFEMNKQKNVAIANLQKLFSKPLATNSSPAVEHVNKPMKLITPDYYEKCKSSDVPKEHESETKGDSIINNLVHLNVNCEYSKEATKYSSNQNSLNMSENCDKLKAKTISLDAGLQHINIALIKKDHNLIETCSSDPQIRDTRTIVDTSVQNLNKSNPQVQDSIKKVNRWLNKTDSKLKPSPICLSPLAYKRKDINCKSPNGSAENKHAKSDIEEYKPSAYAEELMKSYTERATNLKKRKEKVTLSNLHEVLKEKDEQIRAKNANKRVECSASELNLSDSA